MALLTFIAEILMKFVRWDIVFMADITRYAIGKIGMGVLLDLRDGACTGGPGFSAPGGTSQHNKNAYYAHNTTNLFVHESGSKRTFIVI